MEKAAAQVCPLSRYPTALTAVERLFQMLTRIMMEMNIFDSYSGKSSAAVLDGLRVSDVSSIVDGVSAIVQDFHSVGSASERSRLALSCWQLKVTRWYFQNLARSLAAFGCLGKFTVKTTYEVSPFSLEWVRSDMVLTPFIFLLIWTKPKHSFYTY